MVFKVLSLTFEENNFEDQDRFVIRGRLKRFSLAELKASTQNFSNENIIGRGGFGTVYKGRLADDGSLVAIKRLRSKSKGGEEQFRAEVDFAKVAGHHPNLLRLLGFSMTRKERMLVYPLMVKRSVASRLRQRPPWEPPLAWHTRKQIALGAAKGLAHLHESCHFQIIHRDVKAANILLDDDFNAVLSDFGLTKFVHHNPNRIRQQVQPSNFGFVVDPFSEPSDLEEEEEDLAEEESCWNFTRTMGNYENSNVWFTGGDRPSCWQCRENFSRTQEVNKDLSTDDEVATAVRGTIGHIAPEYLSTGKCSIKNDVFAYGNVLLELISGQRAFDLARVAKNRHVMLLEWVKRLMKEKELALLVDSNMRGNSNYDAEVVEQLLQVALLCTNRSPRDRPKMTQVMQMLVDDVFLARKWKEWAKEMEFRTELKSQMHLNVDLIRQRTRMHRKWRIRRPSVRAGTSGDH